MPTTVDVQMSGVDLANKQEAGRAPNQPPSILRNSTLTDSANKDASMGLGRSHEEARQSVAFDVPHARQTRNTSRSASGSRKRGPRSRSDPAKRQEQRLAKNRISAAKSRERRKKYVQNLEKQVNERNEMEKEIIRLKTVVNSQRKQLEF